MKATKIVLLSLVFLFLFYGCGLSPHIEPALNKKISRDDSVEKFILANGLTVVAKRMTKAPLVSIELLVKTGSAGEGNYLGTGIAHFTEHMLFKGNEKGKAGDIARQIKQLGGDIDGFTNYDCTGFAITVPRENLGCALEILSGMVFSPHFDKEQFDKELNVILNEIRMNEDAPERRLSRLFWANAYLTHPYRHPVIGYRNLLAKLTPEDLSAFHKSEYVPNNMVLSVAGDFNREDLKSLVENKILVPERGAEKEIFYFPEDSPVSPRYYEEGFDTKIMYLLTGFQGTGISDDDLFALDILSIIFGEGDSSRLGSRLRLKENIVYSILSFNHTPKDKGIFGIFLTAEYKDKELIEKEIIEEIEKIKKYSVRKDELERAKNIVISRFNFARETVESQALELASNEFFIGDPDFNARYVEGVKGVTRGDLTRVARKYLHLSKLITVVLRPQDAVRKKEIKDTSASRGEIEEIKFENGLTLLLREERSLPL
ncbi:MAG: pitrilysin family protein, partial [Candidatus Omnitrophica bacterium]|nr:pitrilysin family protein [Candidatus Omnitrophota bacterium]